MATATYQRTIDVGQEPERKAVAVVDVDGVPVEVTYWPSLIAQWTPAGVIAYLEAEALWVTGNYADARARLADLATTEAWAQRWIEEHPDPVAEKTWEVDPLLG